jgi:hypothetical protein
VIGPSGTVRVMVATKPVDFRNYAERTVMQSPRRADRSFSFINSLDRGQ